MSFASKFIGKSLVRSGYIKARLGLHKKITSTLEGSGSGFDFSKAKSDFDIKARQFGAVTGSAVLARAQAGASKIDDAGDLIYNETLNIIQSAYTFDYFYKASWRKKSRILAKSINESDRIQNPQSTVALGDIIFGILESSRNRLGNEKLAERIINKAHLDTPINHNEDISFL